MHSVRFRFRLLLLPLLATVGAAASAADIDPNAETEVWATRTISAAPDAVYRYLLNLRHHEELWSKDCVKKWEHGAVSEGPGASVLVVYTPSMMHRKLTATLSRAEPDTMIELDHAGERGFALRWLLTPSGEGATDVEVHTYVLAPPEPFTKMYFNKIRPAWEACHSHALAVLEQKLR